MKSHKHIIAVAASDWHIGLWKSFNEGYRRTEHILQTIQDIAHYATLHGVPLLFAGDLFDKPNMMENELAHFALPSLYNTLNIPGFKGIIAISGNHDQCQANFHNKPSMNWVGTLSKILPNLTCVDFTKTTYRVMDKTYVVYGIPYLTGNVDMADLVNNMKVSKAATNILLVHTDLHGALDTDGREVDSVHNLPKDMDTFFDKFDWVLSGHIHRSQKLTQKVIMLGASDQQDRGDADCQMGYWLIYSNHTAKFVKLKHPRFKDYEEGDEIDDYHYWSKITKEFEKKKNDTKNFTVNQSRVELGKKYLDHHKVTDKARRKALIKTLKQF